MDEQERVEYVFTGDVSSLQEATSQAISLLGKYEKTVKSLSTSSNLDLGKSVFSGFQKTVDGIIKKISSASVSMSKASAGNQQSMMPDASASINKAVQMRDQINSIVDSMTVKIRTMSSAFDPLISKLTSYRDKTANTMSQTRRNLDSVASAFRRVAQSTDSSEAEANQSAAAHLRLESSAQRLASTVKTESSLISKEKKELESKNRTLQQSSKQHDNLASVIVKLGKMLSSEITKINNFTSALRNASKGTNVLRKALSRLSAVQIGKWLAAGVKESIDYVENLNLFTVAMGDSVEEAKEFVDAMAEIYGLDPSSLYRYVGYFNQLTDAIGMTSEASSSISLSLTKAAADISSLFNVDVETVVDDLASGMQGMSRAVRKYGMDIRATTLQQTALTYGLTQQVETMSEADRMALRYLTMMQQVQNAINQTANSVDGTNGAMGDFARNIESPANQLRIFREQITQLGRAIGNFFIPMLRAVLPWINGIVMALRTVLEVLAELLGFTVDTSSSFSGVTDSVDNIGSSVGAVGDSAEEATKKLKKMLAPFDELNVMPEQKIDVGSTDVGSTDLGLNGSLNPVLLDALKDMELDLDNIKMKANEIRDRILEFLGFEKVKIFDPETGEMIEKLVWFADKFKANLIDMFPQWEQTITALFENWTAIMEGLKHVWESLLGVIEKVFEKLRNLIDSLNLDSAIAEFINNLAGSLERLSTWINTHSDAIANFIIILGALKLGFTGLSVVTSLITPVVKFITTVSSAIGGFSSTIAIIAAVVAGIALLYTQSEAFATAFNQLLQTFWAGLQPMIESVVSLFTTLWESLQRLWAEHLQPMVVAVGDFFALVLNSIGVLWETVSAIFVSVAGAIEVLWVTVIEPVLGAFFNAITGLMEICSALWAEVIDPVIKWVAQGLQSLWIQHLQPIMMDIIAIIGMVMEVILALWNQGLKPFIDWLVAKFGPYFSKVFEALGNDVMLVVKFIAIAIQTLVGVFRGLIEFVAGVLTSDWRRALSGIANIFVDLGNGVIMVIEAIVNYAITYFNTLLANIANAATSFVMTINSILSSLGMRTKVSVSFTAPKFDYISIPRIPRVALASGGVVTGPTNALIGEGKYDEAVIPLGNSPQMKELINQIAEATRDKSNNEQIPVQIFLDGDVLFDAVVERARAAKMRTGESVL